MPNNDAQPDQQHVNHTQAPDSATAGDAAGEGPPLGDGERTLGEYVAALTKLLSDAGVKRIIWVDDDFAYHSGQVVPEEYFSVLEDADCRALPGLTSVPEGLPEDVRLDRLRATWRSLTADERLSLHAELRKLTADRDIELPFAVRLAQHLSSIPECEVETISLKQWRETHKDLVGTRFDGKFTLLLIDQDYTKESGPEEGGTEILKALQSGIPDEEARALRCALLTQKPSISEEHHTWNRFASQHGLNRSRFMLISKERLSEDCFGGLILMLRLTLLNPQCESLRTEAETVYQAALDHARQQIAGITIYDMEQIVFASSRREGVWEPDTLFRILGMYLRREARKLAQTNTNLRNLSDSIRQLAGANLLDPSPKQEGTKALEIRQIELYEDPGYLNKHCTPIDLGDIFEIVPGPGAPAKHYILIAQPCDMMVRFEDPAGERKRGISDGMMLEVISETANSGGPSAACQFKYDPGLMARLDYYHPSGAHAYVDFATARPVNLAILDLCVMREDGKAELAAFDRTIPDGLIPSWRLHHYNLRVKLRGAGDRWHEITQACSGVDKQHKPKLNNAIKASEFGAVFGPNLWIPFTPTRKGKDTHISFNCRRIRRLNQPWSGALLTLYTQYLSRAAFEHDYGSIGFDTSYTQSPASPGDA
ncbi:hypothetical protein [Paludisphaera sp.]|uniref:hypothetical protein n=1 Tax=Paludisphaera sp. TaxID=2017432 RepID=UPI00301BCC60